MRVYFFGTLYFYVSVSIDSSKSEIWVHQNLNKQNNINIRSRIF